MAKQNFTTGQILTANQMLSLQQTAMGGGSPSQKTASYVLVAADAGTVIQMNSASATTITVNTSLFSAGDSVQIQNIGSGTTTITAGTATVNSAGSLAVTQYDGGFLYFTTASAALWFDYTQAGTTSPLTTKGDLYTRTSSADSRLAVGANGTTLVADSAEATGLKWATPSSGGMTSLASGTLTSGSSLALTSISGSHKHLQLLLSDIDIATAAGYMSLTFMGLSTNYTYQDTGFIAGTSVNKGEANASNVHLSYNEEYWDTGNNNANLIINIYNYADSTTKIGDWMLYYLPRFASARSIVQGTFNNSNASAQAALTSITLTLNGGSTFSAGNYILYGVS